MLIDKENISESLLRSWFEDHYTPIEIEVGSGSGRFLCESAQRLSDVRFVGVELNRKRCIDAVDAASKFNLPNLIFVNIEAQTFFINYVPSNLIREIHIYFPSPYPFNSRVLDQGFVDQMYRTLRLDGSARIVTDHREYFEQIYNYFASERWQHINWCRLDVNQGSNLLVGTSAEIKYGGRYVIQVVK